MGNSQNIDRTSWHPALRRFAWRRRNWLAIVFAWIFVIVLLIVGFCHYQHSKKEPAACNQLMTLWKDELEYDATAMLARPNSLSDYVFKRAKLVRFYTPRRAPSLDRVAANGGRGYVSSATLDRMGRVHIGLVCLWINDDRLITDIVVDDKDMDGAMHHD